MRYWPNFHRGWTEGPRQKNRKMHRPQTECNLLARCALHFRGSRRFHQANPSAISPFPWQKPCWRASFHQQFLQHSLLNHARPVIPLQILSDESPRTRSPGNPGGFLQQRANGRSDLLQIKVSIASLTPRNILNRKKKRKSNEKVISQFGFAFLDNCEFEVY